MGIGTKLRKMSGFLPDWLIVSLDYLRYFKRLPNLKNPKTFNEKIQWLKLYDRNPAHTEMVDKYAMKAYVDGKVGAGHVVPLLGVWDRVEDIDFDQLPSRFVLKTTHDCGGLVICSDKTKLDVEKAQQKLQRALKNDYYVRYREWPYKNVKPRIIAEQFLVDESGTELKDYKFWCFSGQPCFVAVDYDRATLHKQRLYSLNWERMEESRNYADDPSVVIEKPDTLEKMIEIATVLAKDEAFVRVDFYSVDHVPYVGEITFFPASGYGKFVPDKYDRIYGDMIKLPKKQDNSYNRPSKVAR